MILVAILTPGFQPDETAERLHRRPIPGERLITTREQRIAAFLRHIRAAPSRPQATSRDQQAVPSPAVLGRVPQLPRRRGARGGPRRAVFIGNPLPVLAFNGRVCAVPRARHSPRSTGSRTMRRSSKRPSTRTKSLTSAAGDAIGHAAIAATRVVIRKARMAVRSADRALYGAAPVRKRVAVKAAKRRARAGNRRKKARSYRALGRGAAARKKGRRA